MLSNAKPRTAGKNLKTTIITALLLLAMVSGAVAQEKWEYAMITYISDERNLTVSYDSREFEFIEVPKASLKSGIWRDYSPALKQLAKMTSDGWEVFNTATIGGSAIALNGQIFYLRKKKN